MIPVTSTAKAAQDAKEDEEGLAICSLKCAEVYDLDVVDTDIQDAGFCELFRFLPRRIIGKADIRSESIANTTRFIALSRSDCTLPDRYPIARPKRVDAEPEQ